MEKTIPLKEDKGGFTLYNGAQKGDKSYDFYGLVIDVYWKGIHKEGTVTTKTRQISKDEFLDWLRHQSNGVKQEVYDNIVRYLEKPKEEKKRSRHPELY